MEALTAAYEVGGRRFEIGSPGLVAAIAEAYAARLRPRCMCFAEGVEMYVARVANGHIVKRMPGTGSRHAPNCPSYELPAEFYELNQTLGSAITEDLSTGNITLKLDFSLSKLDRRPATSAPCRVNGGSVSRDARLSMRSLLHYLWDQAELTHWHPGFEGKRSWATVRRHLLRAAEGKFARHAELLGRLYVPEVFCVPRRDEINARRIARCARISAAQGRAQHLMLLIAELKEIVPTRFGARATVKHLPDLAFALDERLYRRLCRRFEPELSMWGSAPDLHMVIIATFGVSTLGVPTISELSLMPVNRQWLPVQDTFECLLLDTLARENRHFIKVLRYDMPLEVLLPAAALTDIEQSPLALYLWRSLDVDQSAVNPTLDHTDPLGTTSAWVWRDLGAEMPPLPRPTMQGS
ncbi:DUF1173 family protein [Ideonella azotifigens]|uniref:DUF1173 domain-containing protein n=2 Tax=Ideonella azotifigens TaxID=513160 RepID=A0ABN1JH09_9BURK|nr:DUF1173 family protein [Ideonella azotifigens]